MKEEGKGNKVGNSVTKTIDFIVEQSFLSLEDQYSRVMVYGRVPARNAEPIEPDFNGAWVGHFDTHDNFPATFDWDGKTLTIKYEHDGSSFTGRLEQGYFIGQVKGGKGPRLAALCIGAWMSFELILPNHQSCTFLGPVHTVKLRRIGVKSKGRYSFGEERGGCPVTLGADAAAG